MLRKTTTESRIEVTLECKCGWSMPVHAPNGVELYYKVLRFFNNHRKGFKGQPPCLVAKKQKLPLCLRQAA